MNLSLRHILIVAGVILVLTASALGMALITEDAPTAVQETPPAHVLIAAQAIAAGERVEQADIGWRKVNAEQVPEGAITREARSDVDIIGAVASRNLAPGELLTERVILKAPSARTLAGNVNPGWRAITVAADASQMASGMILPNDHVDLILAAGGKDAAPTIAVPFMKGKGPAISGAYAEIPNVRVIAINGKMEPEDASSGVMDSDARNGGTITFEVMPANVAPILSAATGGQLIVSLRSRLDAVAPPAHQQDMKPVRDAVPPPRQAAGTPLRSGIWPMPGGAVPSLPVTIIRGGGSSRAQ